MKRGKSISDWVTGLDPSPSLLSSDGVTAQTTRKRTALKKYPSTSKRKKTTPLTKKQSFTIPVGGVFEAWSLKYSPKSSLELAVHKKKISEVQQWLEVALSFRTHRPILLLTGPAGCGKTATVHALSHEMGFSIVEWSNPIDLSPVGVAESGVGTFQSLMLVISYLGTRVQDYQLYESQLKQFTSFLLRANKYPSLVFLSSSTGEREKREKKKSKIVLIEDLPNAIIRDPSQLHQLLRTMKNFLYPLIFIVSDTQRKTGTSSQLFPSSVTSELDIHTISFNPIAQTSMVKTLQRIADTEHRLSKESGRGQTVTPTRCFLLPKKEVIETIAESSSGDIRSAINSLQFACLRGNSEVALSDKGKMGGANIEHFQQTSGIGGRDCPLFLFRALGKILYCKRSTDDVIDSTPLPSHLSHHKRARLLTEPETVFDSVNMSSDLFTLYLHQNYLDFFAKIEDVAQAIEYLSDSDVLSSVWTDSQVDRRVTESCSSSVCCRGLQFANTELSSSKWRSLHKPQWNTVHRQYVDNCAAARALFLHLGASPHSHLWLPVELQTEFLPFLAFINKPLRNLDQASILHTLTNFRKTYQRKYSSLGETEFDEGSSCTASSCTPAVAVEEDDDITMATLSQTSGTMTTEYEETNEIEEFEDDQFW